MAKPGNFNEALRVIDANQNRAKEGLRVCEEAVRFILNDAGLTRKFRNVRHGVSRAVSSLPAGKKELLKQRGSETDVGRDIPEKVRRASYQDVFSANIQRVKEALRVLEEFSRLLNRDAGKRFKALRFKTYDLEKETVERFSFLCDNR